MSNYTTVKIMDNFYSIELNSMVRSFLFIGEEDAILVDTCTGEGDILAEIKKLTDLPVSVIFTHSDGDHVGAAKYFEDCFMHPCEFDYYKSKTDDPVEMIPIWEGDGLDIGTFSFEVILIPGHTPGSIALLEPDKNFLIGGDSIQTGGSIFMFGPGRNFEAFRASMAKLEEYINEFGVIYSSHNDLEVLPATIGKLYNGATIMLTDKPEGKQVEAHGQTFNQYEIDGISFFAS